MAIDEVIKKLKSDAITDSYNFQGYSMKQKEQIAEWLEELKEARKCFEENRKAGYKHGFSDGYNKAIDDVMKKAREIQEAQIKNLEQSPMRSGKRWAIYMGTHLGYIQVACTRLIKEQLKSQTEL